MQTLDPGKQRFGLGSGALNFPVPSRKFSKSFLWCLGRVGAGNVVWAGFLSMGGSQHVSSPSFYPLWLSNPRPCGWVGLTPKCSRTCACGVILGPWSWAAAAWWVYKFCWQRQYCFHGMVWDWATRMMLTLWFWVILTHLDAEWIQDSELLTAHSQPLSLSFMCDLLNFHSPITLLLWWCLWATSTQSGRCHLPCANYPHAFAAGTQGSRPTPPQVLHYAPYSLGGGGHIFSPRAFWTVALQHQWALPIHVLSALQWVSGCPGLS